MILIFDILKQALELFERRYEIEKQSFQEGVSNPNLLKPVLFTKEVPLSPYFRFGCLSVRYFFWKIKDAYEKVNFIFRTK